MKKIGLYYYTRKNNALNFGDDLSPALIQDILKIPTYLSTPIKAEIIAIGSVLQYWKKPSKKFKRHLADLIYNHQPLTLWGTGLISPCKLCMPKCEILALRGPLTAKYTNQTTDLFADPGILAGNLVPKAEKDNLIAIIPHYIDKKNPIIAELSKLPEFKIIDVERPYHEVLLEISKSDIVLSSSLHGLIVADSYDIPNSRLLLSNNVDGGDFKFDDYALGIDRPKMTTHHIHNLDDIYAAARQLEKKLYKAEKSIIQEKSLKLRQSLEKWAISRSILTD